MKKFAIRILYFVLGAISTIMLFLVLAFIFTDPNPQITELGDDYYYDDVIHFCIYPECEFNTYRNYDRLIDTSRYSIPPIVDYCDFNDRFIVAIQRSRWSSFRDYYHKYNLGNHTLEEFNKLYLRDRKGRYFWVIDKKTPSIYGPLLQEEFTTVCDSMNVPEKMVNKMLDDYKNSHLR